MTQKPAKKAHELTTKEAVERLFHPDVVEHAKRHIREADDRPEKPAEPSKKKSMNEE